MLYESAPVVVPSDGVTEAGSLSGVPSSGTAGTALAGPITFTVTGSSTPYVALVTTAAVLGQSAAGKIVGSAVALSGTSGMIPSLTPGAAGMVRLALLNGSAGTILALSGNITVAAAPLVESGSLSGVPSSGTAGSALANTATFTATNISTPYAALVTSAATVGQAVGSALISGSAVALSGASGAVPARTPPAAGTVYLALLNGPTGTVIARSGAITVAVAPTTQGSSYITLSGVPSSIVAGQPLSGVAFTYPAGALAQVQFVLYNVTTGAEEGPRLLSDKLPASNLGLFTPQMNALYTMRAYNYDFTSLLFESTQIAVAAPPGPLPVRPTQTADTNITSSSVTVNWTATGTSYRVLGRPDIGSSYGSLVDTTVLTNSINLTGLAASSAPRCLIVPQNANGYGTTSAATFSFTNA